MGWKEDAEIDLQPIVSYQGHTVSPICTAMIANDQEMHKCLLDLRHRRTFVQLLAFVA
jgi:hypothetical protein